MPHEMRGDITHGTPPRVPGTRVRAPDHDWATCLARGRWYTRAYPARVTFEGPPIELPGWSMRVKVTAADTEGRLTVLHGLMAPQLAGPAAHVHAEHDETFVVLEGRMRFRVGDRFHTAVPGETVFAGRRLAHGFGNPYDEPASYVVILTPSGYEDYFHKVAQYVTDTGALPGPTLTAELMAQHATVLAGPLNAPDAWQDALTVREVDAGDVGVIRALVKAAYQPYVERIGREPGPMTDDYGRAVDTGHVWVAQQGDRVVGLLVLEPAEDHLLLRNVAVLPQVQGLGVGSRLLQFAEEQARALGLLQIRLYTNAAMTENLAYYPRRGYRETHRSTNDGFHRVFFTKDLH